MMKISDKILFGLCLVLLIYLCLPSLNPLDKRMFDFHDTTQTARISEFTLNLRHGQIPPRLAPELSFGLGFPLFNFYAPFAYWVSSFFHLLGMSAVGALKLSFFTAFVLSFFTMYYFLRKIFNHLASLTGASLYVTSTYLATEIVIRGNLAETWFIALLPLALAMLIENSQKPSRHVFIMTSLVLLCTFTVHNIFSLVAVGLTLIFALLLPGKKRNMAAIFLALLMGSSFFLPALTETTFTHIEKVIRYYYYKDHFLCVRQFWSSNGWSFGPSAIGCDNDQMSFKLGKLHFFVGIVGFTIVVASVVRHIAGKKQKNPLIRLHFFAALLFAGSLFLTTYYSAPIWDTFLALMSLFQFPWRFMLLAMFGMAYLGAYITHMIDFPYHRIMIVVIITTFFVAAHKYLIKPMYDYDEYNNVYNSATYRAEYMAYMMPEYVSSQADLEYWGSFSQLQSSDYKEINIDMKVPVETDAEFDVIKNKFFKKSVVVKEKGDVFINIHYFPYWNIYVNGQRVMPRSFDKLGRPKIQIVKPSTVDIIYEQTLIERVGNGLSIVGILLLMLIAIPIKRTKKGKKPEKRVKKIIWMSAIRLKMLNTILSRGQ